MRALTLCSIFLFIVHCNTTSKANDDKSNASEPIVNILRIPSFQPQLFRPVVHHFGSQETFAEWQQFEIYTEKAEPNYIKRFSDIFEKEIQSFEGKDIPPYSKITIAPLNFIIVDSGPSVSEFLVRFEEDRKEGIYDRFFLAIDGNSTNDVIAGIFFDTLSYRSADFLLNSQNSNHPLPKFYEVRTRFSKEPFRYLASIFSSTLKSRKVLVLNSLEEVEKTFPQEFHYTICTRYMNNISGGVRCLATRPKIVKMNWKDKFNQIPSVPKLDASKIAN